MNPKIEKHFNTSISWHVIFFKIIACKIYNNEIIVNLLCFYTFDMHVLVNKVYEKIPNLVVNICLNTAYILIYVVFFKLLT